MSTPQPENPAPPGRWPGEAWRPSPLNAPLSRRLTGRHRFRIQSRRIQPRHVPHCWHVAAGRIAPPSSADRRRTPPRPARTRNPQSQPPTRPRRRKTRDRCSRACPTLVPNLTDSMSKLMSPPRRSRQRHPPPGLGVRGLGACMSSLRPSFRSRPGRSRAALLRRNRAWSPETTLRLCCGMCRCRATARAADSGCPNPKPITLLTENRHGRSAS